MKIVLNDRQSVLDAGLRYGGSVEAAYAVAVANGLPLSAEPGECAELVWNGEPEGSGLMVTRRYAAEGVVPATGLTDEEAGRCGGIGLMAVGYDFEVG